MNLLIVESPGKIKKLRQILGSGWNIKASRGHFRELANDGEDNLGFDLCDRSIKMRLRPIVKAKLEVDAQVEVWQMAIALADSKIPSSSIVAQAVNLYLAKNDTQVNPFQKGEVCRIVVRGNNKLKGKGGSWCIVEEVNESHCIVNTWNDRLSVPINNLESFGFDDEEDRAIEDVGVRMTKCHLNHKMGLMEA